MKTSSAAALPQLPDQYIDHRYCYEHPYLDFKYLDIDVFIRKIGFEGFLLFFWLVFVF